MATPQVDHTPTIAHELLSNLDYYKRIFSEWRDARWADVQIITRTGFDMSPAGNTWRLNLVKEKPRTTIPLSAEELKRDVVGPLSYSTFENLAGV